MRAVPWEPRALHRGAPGVLGFLLLAGASCARPGPLGGEDEGAWIDRCPGLAPLGPPMEEPREPGFLVELATGPCETADLVVEFWPGLIESAAPRLDWEDIEIAGDWPYFPLESSELYAHPRPTAGGVVLGELFWGDGGTTWVLVRTNGPGEMAIRILGSNGAFVVRHELRRFLARRGIEVLPPTWTRER